MKFPVFHSVGNWRPSGGHAGLSGVLPQLWRPIIEPPMASLQAYQLRGAGAVIHSHSVNAVLATMLDENASEFRITQLEMIKVHQGVALHLANA